MQGAAWPHVCAGRNQAQATQRENVAMSAVFSAGMRLRRVSVESLCLCVALARRDARWKEAVPQRRYR